MVDTGVSECGYAGFGQAVQLRHAIAVVTREGG